MTIGDYFTTFISRLKPTQNELRRARGRRNYVARILSNKEFKILQTLNSGSYARNTMIRPMNDLDLFIYISEKDYTRDKNRIINHLARELRPSFPQNEVEPGARSVKIKYSDGFHVDLVPALTTSRSKLEPAEILDRESNNWIKTSPKKQLEFAKFVKNKDKRYNDLVRIFKSWKAQRRRNFRSYVIELLVADCIISGLPKGFDKAVHRIFEKISLSNLNRDICFSRFYQCPKNRTFNSPVVIFDPSNKKNNVADDFNSKMKEEFLNAWNDSYKQAEKAIKSKSLTSAVNRWRNIFEKFPKRI